MGEETTQALCPGAVLMPWASKVRAIVARFVPGQEDGNALADILFGDVNPSGHLPLSFPPNDTATWLHTAEQYPGVNKRQWYTEGLQVGYRYYDAAGVQPLWPFGHGLSYTTFEYSGLSVTPQPNGDVVVQVKVTNTGKRPGAAVPQLYLGFPLAAGEPPKVFRSFRRVLLQPGETAVATFDTLHPRPDMSIWDTAADGWAPVRGTFQVMVGASAGDIHLQETLVVA
ncbi:putative glycosyl hydrolase [Paratrimastix pyriformis]|uniref:beta-glucosidase n=1 Tax=Paratrimastix pyriformis TaxID=342808 RepID=A0ABQ8UF10_9EUKA|nr:putative glycosyl hydrolase [Paratrimastix pyriformis]